MKKQLLSILFLTPALLFAQTNIQSDNFDSYTAGTSLTTQNSMMWETWSGAVGGIEDPLVSSAIASSVANSINVINGGAGVYENDLVMLNPSTYTTGKYEVKMKINVASNFGGYFNLGGAWVTGGTGYQYGIDVFFNADGSGNVSTPSNGVFTYTVGSWNDVSVMVNLATTTAELKINSVSVGTFPWGAASGFGCMDLFGVGYSDATNATEIGSNFYVDDVELLNWTGVGLTENDLSSNFSVVPNPSNGNVTIYSGDVSFENSNVTVLDIAGKVVFNDNFSFGVNGSNSINLDVVDGIYFVNILAGNQLITKKISVKK
jgi:hypothetical protein